MGKTSVLKALSPEEQTLVAQMKSIIEQLESLQGGGGEGAEVIEEASLTEKDIISAIKKLAAKDNLGDSTEEGIPDKDKEDANKSKSVKKEDNGPTANEDAEDRAEADTDVNDDNLSEVGKTLMQLFVKSKPKKSVQKNIDADIITQAVAKAILPIAQKIQQIETFNSNVLDALGFSDEVEKSLKAPETQEVQKGLNNSKNKPIQSIDATGVVGELVNVIKSLTAEKQEQGQFRNDWNGMQKARKDLADALPFIFKNNLNRNT